MNLTKTTLLSIIALMFAGCSSTPEDAVDKMYDALGSGDMKTLSKYTTKPTLTLLTMGAVMNCNINKADYSSQEEIVSACMENYFGNVDIKNIEVSETSDNKAYAMVTTDNNGKVSTDRLDLIKTDDNWKVSMRK